MLAQYSVPSETKRLLLEGILANPLIQKHLPADAAEAAAKLSFVGSDSPSLPINWRFAESISALKGYEAVVLNVLLKKKYAVEPVQITIDTYEPALPSSPRPFFELPPRQVLTSNARDHAQLFIMSSLLWVLDPAGQQLSAASITQPSGRAELEIHFPSWDKFNSIGSLYRIAATNIYKTKDGRFFHVHGKPSLHDALTQTNGEGAISSPPVWLYLTQAL